VQPLLRGEVLSEKLSPGRLRHDQELFGQWEQDLLKPSDEMHHIVMLEIEGRLRRMIATLPTAATAAPAAKGRGRPGGLHGGELNKPSRWPASSRSATPNS
jgi:hypothetical protein